MQGRRWDFLQKNVRPSLCKHGKEEDATVKKSSFYQQPFVLVLSKVILKY